MSKERLEEIKRRFKDGYDFDVSSLEMKLHDDFAWLLQQAEEKQELERRNNELIEGINHNNKEYGLIIDENEKLKQQNKRYENALKEIIEIWNRPYGDTDAKDMKMVAKQALQNKE